MCIWNKLCLARLVINLPTQTEQCRSQDPTLKSKGLQVISTVKHHAQVAASPQPFSSPSAEVHLATCLASPSAILSFVSWLQADSAIAIRRYRSFLPKVSSIPNCRSPHRVSTTVASTCYIHAQVIVDFHCVRLGLKTALRRETSACRCRRCRAKYLILWCGLHYFSIY